MEEHAKYRESLKRNGGADALDSASDSQSRAEAVSKAIEEMEEGSVALAEIRNATYLKHHRNIRVAKIIVGVLLVVSFSVWGILLAVR